MIRDIINIINMFLSYALHPHPHSCPNKGLLLNLIVYCTTFL